MIVDYLVNLFLIFLTLIGFYCFFKDQIKKFVAKELIELTQEVINSRETHDASETLLKQLFRQKNIAEDANRLLVNVMRDESTKIQAQKIVLNLFTDEAIRNESKKFIIDLLQNDEVMSRLNDNVIVLLNDKRTRNAIHKIAKTYPEYLTQSFIKAITPSNPFKKSTPAPTPMSASTSKEHKFSFNKNKPSSI